MIRSQGLIVFCVDGSIIDFLIVFCGDDIATVMDMVVATLTGFDELQ